MVHVLCISKNKEETQTVNRSGDGNVVLSQVESDALQAAATIFV